MTFDLKRKARHRGFYDNISTNECNNSFLLKMWNCFCFQLGIPTQKGKQNLLLEKI